MSLLMNFIKESNKIEGINVKVIEGIHIGKTGYIHGYLSNIFGDMNDIISTPCAIIISGNKLYEISIDKLEVI